MSQLEALGELLDHGDLVESARRAEALAEEAVLRPFALQLSALAKDFDELGVEELLRRSVEMLSPG